MIVGLSGYAKTGKNEAAKGLKNLGFKQTAFADVLREAAYALDPWVSLHEHHADLHMRLSAVIDKWGWDFAKNEFSDVRRLLQRLGTEAGREIFGKNIWVDTVLNNSEGNIVITDVRFPNEADAIRERGGIVIRIFRPGIGPANAHASENSLEDYEFDYYLENTGGIEELYKEILDIVLGHVMETV